MHFNNHLDPVSHATSNSWILVVKLLFPLQKCLVGWEQVQCRRKADMHGIFTHIWTLKLAWQTITFIFPFLMRNILFFAAQRDSLKIKGAVFYVSLIQSTRFLPERSLLVLCGKKNIQSINLLKFSVRSEKNRSSVSSEASFEEERNSCKEKAISYRYLFWQIPFFGMIYLSFIYLSSLRQPSECLPCL